MATTQAMTIHSESPPAPSRPKRRRRAGAFGILFAGLSTAAPAMAQVHPEGARRAVFSSRAELVLVPVTVTDSMGATVNGLPKDVFSLSENRVTRPIAAFSERDEPVSLGIVFDASGSMKNVSGAARTALRTFVQACNPDDEAFLDVVSTQPRHISGFTADFGTLLDAVAREEPGGDTALVDGVYDGLRELRRASHARRAILVISDGMDNHSRRSKKELMDLALESGAQIYAVSLFVPRLNEKPIEIAEAQRGLAFLSEIAEKTGGMHIVVRAPVDLDPAADRIGRAIRNQYVIGYVPASSKGDRRWRSIRVHVSVPGARVYARSGYRDE